MNKWIIIILIIVMGIIGYMILNKDSSESAQKPKNSKIIAFGDSLVYGYGSTEGNDFVSVLSREINAPIENFGKNEDTTASALERVDKVLLSDPGIVILLIGGNDILRRVPISTTKENIRMLVEKFKKNNTVVILVGVRGAIINDPYAPMYKSIADEYGTLYVPNILDGLIGRSEFMSDAIHPNDKGYARIAEKISKVLSPFSD